MSDERHLIDEVYVTDNEKYALEIMLNIVGRGLLGMADFYPQYRKGSPDQIPEVVLTDPRIKAYLSPTKAKAAILESIQANPNKGRLIYTDVMMPLLTGDALGREIEKSGEEVLSQLYFILTSAVEQRANAKFTLPKVAEAKFFLKGPVEDTIIVANYLQQNFLLQELAK